MRGAQLRTAFPEITTMPDYGHGIKEHDRAVTSYYASLRRWLQIKKYQYEVTFSLYMLTSTEKIIFSMSAILCTCAWGARKAKGCGMCELG